MAKNHYSADSASLPPPRLVLFPVPRDVTGSSSIPVFHGGIMPAGKAFPINRSSIG
jgi:hypothetical protein